MPDNTDLREQLRNMLNRLNPFPQLQNQQENVLRDLLRVSGDKALKELNIIGPEFEDFVKSPIFPLFAIKALEDLVKNGKEEDVVKGIFGLTITRMLDEIIEDNTSKEGMEAFVSAILMKSDDPIKEYIKRELEIVKNKKFSEIPENEREDLFRDRNRVEELARNIINEVKNKINNCIFAKYGIKLNNATYRIIEEQRNENGNQYTVYGIQFGNIQLEKEKNYKTIVGEITRNYALQIKNEMDREIEISEGDKTIKYNPYNIIKWLEEKKIITNTEPDKIKDNVTKIYDVL